VTRFNDNALRIIEVAESAIEKNLAPAEWTIVIGTEGGIRMIGESDWPLESLQSQHGAEMVYRVRQQGTAIRLEGRAGSRTCLFETAKLDGAAHCSGGVSSLLASDRLLRPALPPAYDVVNRPAAQSSYSASRTISVRTSQLLLPCPA
jgi:hypothetical protein